MVRTKNQKQQEIQKALFAIGRSNLAVFQGLMNKLSFTAHVYINACSFDHLKGRLTRILPFRAKFRRLSVKKLSLSGYWVRLKIGSKTTFLNSSFL